MRPILPITMVSLSLVIFGCGGTTDNSERTNQTINFDSVKNTADEQVQFKYDLTISNIPIPFDILSELPQTGADFKRTALNDAALAEKYNQNNQKAINLGIYGADVAYVITFEQYMDVAAYLKAAKKLADDLSIPIAFDQRALTTYEQYKTNKDSLEKLVFDSYAEIDKTLKSNERIGLATLVVVGGWIEGLYTSVRTLGDVPRDDANKLLYSKIWEQKHHLEQLISLLGEFKSDEFFTGLISDLQSVKAVYDNLAVKGEVSQQEVRQIGEKISSLRNKYVAG
ncbi:MAG: hypothetical protein IT233_09790 [Bacteroidia bacterium]|nr:hypothetical protein [Bacteroidia bacterium]